MTINFNAIRILNVRQYDICPIERPTVPSIAAELEVLLNCFKLPPFRPETCARRLYIFADVHDEVQFEQALSNLRKKTQTCEVYTGIQAYRFILEWTVGYNPINGATYFNSSRSGDDRFRLGKVREIWTAFASQVNRTANSSAVSKYDQYMQALFRDVTQIRQLIENGQIKEAILRKQNESRSGNAGKDEISKEACQQLIATQTSALLQKLYEHIIYARTQQLTVEYTVALRLDDAEYQRHAIRSKEQELLRRIQSLDNKLASIKRAQVALTQQPKVKVSYGAETVTSSSEKLDTESRTFSAFKEQAVAELVRFRQQWQLQLAEPVQTAQASSPTFPRLGRD